MKVLIDMNLSPRLIAFFADAGIAADLGPEWNFFTAASWPLSV
jgi:predicted nuclease of predicted toxin-antitoxin system